MCYSQTFESKTRPDQLAFSVARSLALDSTVGKPSLVNSRLVYIVCDQILFFRFVYLVALHII